MNIPSIQGIAGNITPADPVQAENAPARKTENIPEETPAAPVFDRYIPGDAEPEAGGPEEPRERQNPEGRKAERCIADTGQVDREIERLREKAEALKRQLAQVQRELRRKDNDGYRRQHTVFSE